MNGTATLRSHAAVPKNGIKAPVAASARWSLEWIYFSVVMAAWCFVPLARRLLDWRNGFYNPIQITSTIPFLLTIPLVLVCFRADRLARLSPAFRLFAWAWLATFSYGLIVALFAGNTAAAIYETAQYLVPMLVGIWLAGQELESPALSKRLTTLMLTLGGIVAAYGLIQFVQPPPWDVLWIEGGQFTAMGAPLPFAMRVFSTLNSAGPAADFFALTLILALPLFSLKRLWIWPFVSLLGAALLLTLVRASWIAVILGVVVYLLVSPRRLRAIPFLAMYAVLLTFLIASLPAFLGAGGQSDVVMARISSLTDVNHDASALSRSAQIQDALERGLSNPLGSGLGMIGASSALSANPSTVQGNNLDSGYLARFLELGWLGFAGYAFVLFGAIVAMLATIMRPVRRGINLPETTAVVATAVAMCAALAWADAAGDSHLGIDGVLFWMAMALGFRRVAPAAVPAIELHAAPAAPLRRRELTASR